MVWEMQKNKFFYKYLILCFEFIHTNDSKRTVCSKYKKMDEQVLSMTDTT